MADSPLTVIYTANLRGQLDRLPRLFGLIQRTRAAAQGPVLLVDLGHTCDPAVWECAATGGRAVLFILEAMGYDGACFSPEDGVGLGPESAQRLRQKVLVALCSAQPSLGLPPYVTLPADDWQVALAAHGAQTATIPADLIIRAAPAGGDHLDAAARTAWLAAPLGSEIGVARFTFAARRPAELDVQRMPLPDDAPPDATVAAAVDFVRDEARYYQRHQQQGGAHAAG